MDTRERFNTITARIKELPNIRKNAAIYMGLIALGRIRKHEDSRELIAEPFDFFMHNGNILSSVTTAIAAGVIVSVYHHTSEKEPTYFKTKVMTAALIGGAAVNALVETRTGLSLPILPPMFADSTPDAIDFAYGMIGAVGGGVMVLSSHPGHNTTRSDSGTIRE